MLRFICIPLVVLLPAYASAEKEFPLVSENNIPVSIIAPTEPSLDNAVEELSVHLGKITGLSFPVMRDGTEKKPSITLALGDKPQEEGGFILEVTADAVLVSSRTADGISFGVSELLEQLGVRWFMPGELGTVIPKNARPELALQNRTHIPSFAARYFAPTGDKTWDKRMRFGGTYFPSAHGIKLGKDVTVESHPELYAEVDEKRVRRQLCISNPEVLRRAVAAAREFFDANPDKMIYGMGPNERSYYKHIMQEWGKLLPRVFERGYWFNLSDPGFPFSSVHRMRDEIPAAKEYGIYGWRTEVMSHWASELPSHYVAAKLMWDTNTDVDALLEDFYTKFFGPTSAPMKVYFETMDHALRDVDQHTGGSFATPRIYTEAVRNRARKALNEAAAIVTDAPWRERVAVIRLSFDYLEYFAGMQSARDAQEWETAWKQWQSLEATREKLVSFEPPMINAGSSRNYLDRFFKLPVEQGNERSRNGNRVVAALSGDWEFQTDPSAVGQDIGLHRAEVRGGNRQNVSALNTTWSDIGLRYYRGLSWYWQKVQIGKEWEGKRVFLWFGGVDETARVWVNGIESGISADTPFMPFEFDATAAIRPGGENVVTVCVSNNRTDELGTGGIMAPAMFYAPAAGEKAEPQNIRPLRDTFP